MLYHLLVPLAEEYGVFNLFRYLSFRSGGAVLTALLLCFAIGPGLIRWLSRLQKFGQPIRDDGPESHLETKKGTPTMGGLMMLFSIAVSTLLWSDLSNPYVWIVLLVTLFTGALGFMDDFLKLRRFSHRGLPGKLKLLGQTLVAIIACYCISRIAPSVQATHLAVPFFKDILLNLGSFYFIFTAVVIVGASNAVNLT
ncbi:MAG: phospho-N-acetylmuramoyl-pentapeptide-transferase, partial [Rickettsiales bacterium]|nr:phospho-N-acetylmuramoyl-pentapeptide-transferase [Rickettsiales bacterium]